MLRYNCYVESPTNNPRRISKGLDFLGYSFEPKGLLIAP